MGGWPWFYFVAYQEDIGQALEELRRREFTAGRYLPAVPFLKFPIAGDAPAPGSRHRSIEEAVQAAAETGTRSILDVAKISRHQEYGAVAPLPAARLLELFGTERPTRAMVENNMDFFADTERGQGIYVVLYADGEPSEILFAGYSYD